MVKMVHNNIIQPFVREARLTNSKTSSSTKKIDANFRLGRVILIAVALIVISSSL